MIPWEINGDSFTNCNCAYGCPCQFNALPTYGNCEALHSMHIKSGHFAETPLGGLRAVTALWWPGPIHEGKGRVFVIIDEESTEDQRNALLTIMTGQETEPGATIWNVFAATIDEILEPAFLPIDLRIDIPRRKSKVMVDGLVNSAGKPIVNPVTGAEHKVQIHIDNGFEYDRAEIGSGKTSVNGPIKLAFTDTHGQFNELHLNNYGVIRQ
ncbi:DUF1326 domain-containing protein [Pseudomaricurvus alcaniphilus]|uniref:DUF1326 domain-containing protein n=1 Tax=Pseudomaricurvus alcaniphilus TaxID=1166482 RepID=UPI00140A39ED|nr:DUF1326 domain-containing protein [Pseudomaricurvus alcaniphilus]NHN35767.1 DUF1326 domain-containing protein [Pseudomaricurvus alcaniphilus]